MTRSSYPTHIKARAESRDTRLQGLGYRDYNDYLGSPAWAKVKAHYRKLVIEACGLCGSEESLALHHLTYERVGEELPSDLTWLCRTCHNMIHVLEARGEMGLDFSGLSDFERAARYAVDQLERKETASREFADARNTPERQDLMVNNLAQQIKWRGRELPPDRAMSLINDIHEILNDFEKACREGYDYVPKYAKTS